MDRDANVNPRSLAFIHTVPSLTSDFGALAKVHLPEWRSFSIVDESLLRNTIDGGHLSNLTKRRLATYVWSASDAGAAAVVVTCSTLGPAVDAIVPLCPVPLFRIDEGMAIEAVIRARGIGVIATLSTTLQPTVELIERHASERGKPITIESRLVEGAFELMANGDIAAHDAAIRAALVDLVPSVDVVVLAQASMARALNDLNSSVPILTSPLSGIEYVRDRLRAGSSLS